MAENLNNNRESVLVEIEELANQRVDISNILQEGQEVRLSIMSGTQPVFNWNMQEVDQDEVMDNPGNDSEIPLIDLTDDEIDQPPNPMPPPPPKTAAPIPCLNESRGCNIVFQRNIERNHHLPKCVYSVLNYCKHKDCIRDGYQRFDTFNELVAHTKTVHKCPTIKGNDRDLFRIMMNIERDFFVPKRKDFSSKILATYEQMVHGHPVCIAFVAVAEDEKQNFSILPIIYGEQQRLWDFVKIKLCLLDQKGKLFRPIDPLLHESHKIKNDRKFFCRAYGPGKPLFDAMKNDHVIKFRKDDLLGNDNDGLVKLALTLKAMFYRCTIKKDEECEISPYLLTLEEVSSRESVQEMLKLNTQKEELVITGVVLPQLKSGCNVLAQSIDFNQVIRTFLVMVLETILDQIADPFQSVHFKKKVAAVILLPSEFMLHTTGTFIQEMSTYVGLDSVILSLNENDREFRYFVDHGCNVLITSASTFLRLTQDERVTLSDVLFENLRFALLPHSDYVLYEDKREDIQKCFEIMQKNVQSNLIKVTVSPLLCKEQKVMLKSDVFGSENFLTIYLGPKHDALLEPLPIFELKASDVTKKINMVVNLIRTDNHEKRWVILAPEYDPKYAENFDLLHRKIDDELTEKKNLVIRRDETTDSNYPDCFRSFEIQSGSLLLTSYFSLHYESVTKNAGGVIIFQMPSNYADAMRAVQVVHCLDKPLYAIRKKSSNDISFNDFTK